MWAQVSGSSGAFSTSVPIAVPSFHGLEPSIALVYNSSGRNSTIGVGWSLTGFSYIERQSTDGGSPQYDSTDSFRLGGNDLRPCGASSSPGCLAGGTHFTEHENYQRITFDGSVEWTVEQQNGTKRTYTPVFTVSSETFRWGLTEVEDTVGNIVTYNWWCERSDDCYPDNVTYNGYRVQIYYRNDRTDIMSFATGASIAETAQLVRTIKVELTDGTPIRAYELSHSTSGSTQRTRLDSVQMFGNDVVVGVDGVITGGSSLPAETFTYMSDPDDDEFTDGSSWMSACGNNHAGTGDFNGDGLQDYYCHDEWGRDLDVGYSTGTTFSATSFSGVCDANQDWMSTGDFAGTAKPTCAVRNRAGRSTSASPPEPGSRGANGSAIGASATRSSATTTETARPT